MSDEDTPDEFVLSEAEVDFGRLSEGTTGDMLLEATMAPVVPKKGRIFDADGFCSVSVIRPCVSRGARLRDLPPIYTPRMLEANAGVFDGWLMYVDHLSESGLSESEVEELLAEARRARKVDEMGGRLIQTRWDPTFRTPSDDTFGYQPGSVMGRAKPVPRIREMIENDPELLHTSINAYPRAARKGVAPWDRSQVGMIVEGIRAKPVGSVDWVPRGGAGGHVTVPSVAEAAGSTPDPTYHPGDDDVAVPRRTPVPIDLTTTRTPEELREAVRAEAPELAEAAWPAARPAAPAAAPRDGMSRSEVEQMLAEQRTQFERQLRESADEFDEGLEQRGRYDALERRARREIKGAGLIPALEEGLLAHYGVTEAGVGQGLLHEADDAASAWAEVDPRLTAEIETAKRIMRESAGSSLVEGLGGTRQGAERRSAGVFRDFLKESSGKDVSDEDVKTMIKGAVD